jgi:hypothetical protein
MSAFAVQLWKIARKECFLVFQTLCSAALPRCRPVARPQVSEFSRSDAMARDLLHVVIRPHPCCWLSLLVLLLLRLALYDVLLQWLHGGSPRPNRLHQR